MAFVIERIPEEALRGFLSEHRVYQGIKPAFSSKWAMDHEQNAIFVATGNVGGSYEGTQETIFYSLYWNGEQIRMAADSLRKVYTEQGAVMCWKVHHMQVPTVLHAQHDVIIKLIRDAFTVVGEFFNGDRFASVNVEFDSTTKL